jgi:broad specificity phosphatase PhoE
VFQELAEQFSGKRVLIVTHGGVLVRLYRFLGGEVPPEGKVPIPGNASVSRVRYDHERKIWSLIAWNQNYSPQSDSSAKPPAL